MAGWICQQFLPGTIFNYWYWKKINGTSFTKVTCSHLLTIIKQGDWRGYFLTGIEYQASVYDEWVFAQSPLRKLERWRFPPRTKRRSGFKLCVKAPVELYTFIQVSVTITWVTGLCRWHVELQTVFLLSGSFYPINFSLTLFKNTICAVFDFAANYIRSVFKGSNWRDICAKFNVGEGERETETESLPDFLNEIF